MLIRRADLDAILRGEIDLAFRRWKRPTVKTGGTLKTAAGVLAIEEVERVAQNSITVAQAKRAGFATRSELLAQLAGRTGDVYRVRLRFSGADPRIALRTRAKLSASERDALLAKLAGYDRRSKQGPWTARVLRCIDKQPGVLAGTLATELGFERAWFKANVRKLKELGLTESLEVGYRLSPRGRSFLSS